MFTGALRAHLERIVSKKPAVSMLPQRVTTSALLCVLSTLLAQGVRGADVRIPVPMIVATSRPLETSQPTTDNNHALPAYNATVINGSDSFLLSVQSTLPSRARDTHTTILQSSDELSTGYSITEQHMTQCCDDETSNSATQPLNSVSLAGTSTDSHENTTIPEAKISYETYSQQLPLPARVQVDDQLTELLTIPVSSHYLTEIFPKMFQLSSTPAPDQDASSLSTQASAFYSTESEQANRLDVTPSMLASVTTEVSTSSYKKASIIGATAVLLGIPSTDSPSKTHEQPPIDDRPTSSYETPTLATDFMTTLYEISSKSNVNVVLVPATQFTVLPSTQGEASSAVGLETASPDGQATETHSTQYQQAESTTVTELSLETRASTENDEPLKSVTHRASTSATHTTELQTEIDKLASNLDEVSLFIMTQTTELPSKLYQQSYDVSTTTLPLQTRGSELFTNLNKKPFFDDLGTISPFATLDGTTESATERYPVLPRVSVVTASQLNALATESWHTHQELSTSVGLLTSLYARQQYQSPDGVEVMSSLFETRDNELSTNQYVLPSGVSETTWTSTTPTTEVSSENTPKFNLTGFFRQTQATELPSKKEDSSSIYLSIMHTYRAPPKELSTSTSASITAIALQASDRAVIVTAAVVGSVVFLAIVCGVLLLLAYRAGKTGSFLLPKLHPSGTHVEMSDPFLRRGRNHASTPPANGCGNAAFV